MGNFLSYIIASLLVKTKEIKVTQSREPISQSKMNRFKYLNISMIGKFFQVMFFVSLITQTQGALLTSIKVQTSPSTVQASNAQLIVFGQLSTAVPSGGFFQITGPSISELIMNQGNNLVCFFVQPSTATISGCQSLTQNVINVVVSSFIPADFFEIHINNSLTNPDSTAPTSSFILATFDKSSNPLDNQQSGIILVATSGIMASGSLTPASQIVGASSTLVVKFTPTHYTPAGGVIQVMFPKWNPQASASNQLDYLTPPITCKTVEVLSSSLVCSFSNQILTVTNAFGVEVDGLQEVAFSVTNFRNPISTTIINGFSIQTLSDTTLIGIIDTLAVTVVVSTPATLTSVSLAVDLSTPSAIQGVVQESNNMKILFSSPVPLNTGCSVKVFLPPQFSQSTVTQVQTMGAFGATTVVAFTKASSDNSISFSQCLTYLSNIIPAGIMISSLTMPPNTKPTSSLTITIADINGGQIASITNGVTFQPVFGPIAALTVTPVNPIILSTSGIQFAVTPTHTLDTTTEMVIQFPTSYIIPSTCTVTGTQNMNSAASCTVSGQSMTLTNLLTTLYTKGSGVVISFTLNQVQLPVTTAIQTGFSLTLLGKDLATQVYYSIDSFSGPIPATLINGLITAVVTPASLICYASTTYVFTITPPHYIPQFGYITIIYPPSISIASYSYSQSLCGSFVGFVTTPSCVINTSTSSITIQSGFTTAQGAANTKYSFSIPGILNPVDFTKSNSFLIYTYAQGGSLIDKVESGVTVQMGSTAQIKSIVITQVSYVNSQSTQYQFMITPTVPVVPGNVIIIQFPPEITIPTTANNLVCGSADSLTFTGITCQFHPQISNSILFNIILVPNKSQINALDTFQIQINNIINPQTTKPTSQFNIYITNAQFSSINQSPNNITIRDTSASVMLNAQLTQNDTGAGQYANYTFSLYPLHNIQIGGGIQITYPAQINITNQTSVTGYFNPSYTKLTPNITVVASARQITISNMFQLMFTANGQTVLQFSLSTFINPLKTNITDSFIIRTFNQENPNYYYIDEINSGMVLNSLCNYPCGTCLPALPSLCLSCFQSGTLNKLQGGTCNANCQSGTFYNTITNSCQTCDPSCLACSGSATTCTQCGLGNLLYLLNGKCTTGCPTGYVTDNANNLCAQCTNGCLTCQNSPSYCTTCNPVGSQPFFFQNQCFSNCPKDISVTSGSKCIQCDQSCSTCSGTYNNCTSCLSNMKYDFVQHTCTQMCSAYTQIFYPLTNLCVNCDSSCQTCAVTTTNCSSCKSNLVLNTDTVCRATCGNINQTAVNSICQQCLLPCAQCKDQTSHCTKCFGEYYLYNTTCVQYCPDKYVPENSTMQCVLVGLICPFGFTVNEAGDGCVPNAYECQSGYILNSIDTACVPGPGGVIPFPFIFVSIALCIVVVGSYIKDKQFTKILTCLIALIGSQEIIIYMIIVVYSGYLVKWPAFILSIIAVLMLITSNIAFYLMYKKDILKDQVFKKWTNLHPRTQKWLLIFTMSLNFKVIKFIYSGFFGFESCIANFEDPVKNFYKPMRLITFFSFIFVYIPIILADVYILATTIWGYQLFVLAIESLILALFIVIMTILEFRKPSNLILSGDDEQYMRIKPRSYGDQNVMSVLVDVDESTLIRSKVIDDEYEINLRKKALASILDQVGKNYNNSLRKGIDLGGNIDQCLTKFDENRIKRRRAFSLENIQEEDSWIAQGDNYLDSDDDDDSQQRRYSYPMTPRTKENVRNPEFNRVIKDIQVAAKGFELDNVYADCRVPDKSKEKSRKKTVSRRTQTYLRELLLVDGEAMQDSDLEIILEDEAEIDQEYARGLIDNVLDGLSESESNLGKKRRSKKKKGLNNKRKNEIPEFELADIMGDFEIDDLGNFIILRGEKEELLDKKEKRVNRRGYLIDRFGNIVNKQGQIIFKQVELDSDDEIPAPFGFEKRKKNLLNMNQNGEFKVEGGNGQIPDDEDLIDKELKNMAQQRKKKQRMVNGKIVEGDEDDSSVDSLMAESPGKYQLNEGPNDNDIINKVTKQKVPKKRLGQKKTSPNRLTKAQLEETGEMHSTKKSQPFVNHPPKRIKRDNTKDIFPQLGIENQEQKKLFKIAESIGGLATQMANDINRSQMSNESLPMSQTQQNQRNQELFEKIKQDHLKDIYNEGQSNKRPPMHEQVAKRVFTEAGQALSRGNQSSDQKLQQRHNPEKIYGNLNDIVSLEERMMYDQMRAETPFSTHQTTRLAKESSNFGGDRRMKGLESIYLQKFDKKLAHGGPKRQPKAKFRNTMDRFIDDPELLLEDGIDMQRHNDTSIKVADKLDRLQKQYMVNTASSRFPHQLNQLQPVTSMGFNPGSAGGSQSQTIPVEGGLGVRKTGSVSGSMFNQDPALKQIKIGNWAQKDKL